MIMTLQPVHVCEPISQLQQHSRPPAPRLWPRNRVKRMQTRTYASLDIAHSDTCRAGDKSQCTPVLAKQRMWVRGRRFEFTLLHAASRMHSTNQQVRATFVGQRACGRLACRLACASSRRACGSVHQLPCPTACPKPHARPCTDSGGSRTAWNTGRGIGRGANGS